MYGKWQQSVCQGSVGNDMSEIRECKTVATSDFVTVFGDVFKSCPIGQGNGGRHGGKVHVVHGRRHYGFGLCCSRCPI